MREAAGTAEEGRVPSLHVLVTDRVAAGPGDPETLEALFGELGSDLAVHVRLKGATGRETYRLAGKVAGAARRHGGWCVVNERVDVALAVGARAVQLGGGAMPVSAVRPLVGDGTAVGVSVHSVEQARRAARDGANYLLLGTIFPTPSHPDVEGAGPGLVEACREAGPPVVAIGGIDASRAGEVRRAGARGMAVIRAVWEADDPVDAAGRLLEAWRESGASDER